MTETLAVRLPAPGDVHIWQISLDDDLLDDLQVLSADELLRYGGFQHQVSRQRFLRTRVAMRRILAVYLAVEPGALVFSYSKNGKPGLATADVPEIHFNLSHCEAIGLLAVAHDCEVGIDIEKVRTQRNYYALASRFFTATEAELLREAADSELFYRMWTLKEAHVKLRGLRLLAGLNRFESSLDNQGVVTVIDRLGQFDRSRCSDAQWLYLSHYMVAIAASCRNVKVIMQTLDKYGPSLPGAASQ